MYELYKNDSLIAKGAEAVVLFAEVYEKQCGDDFYEYLADAQERHAGLAIGEYELDF